MPLGISKQTNKQELMTHFPPPPQILQFGYSKSERNKDRGKIRITHRINIWDGCLYLIVSYLKIKSHGR